MAVNLATITTLNRVPLYQGQPGVSPGGTVYTATTDVRVTEILVCNTTALAATLTLHRVPSAGAAGVANRVLSGMTVGPGKTEVINLATALASGDFLSAFQSTAAALTVTISGETYA